ncbi:mRNA 3' end processing factor [Marasmius tenuissimus]|nr:mRNA 3' end processing factor [Marasmius tenuissimus]
MPPDAFHSYQYMPSASVPSPVYYVDPATFRRDFSQRLAEPTFNSRPIIQSLSMFAQDYVRFAEVIAQCLETHIRRVPPWIKLLSFYLLDTISKNIYDPYIRHGTLQASSCPSSLKPISKSMNPRAARWSNSSSHGGQAPPQARSYSAFQLKSSSNAAFGEKARIACVIIVVRANLNHNLNRPSSLVSTLLAR